MTEHKFVALSSWSIDTDTITVVAVCRACELRGSKSVLIEDHDEGLVEYVGTKLVTQAEKAVEEHIKAVKLLASRPGAAASGQKER